MSNKKEKGRFDPILLEVLWNRLVSIAEEQARTLIRAAFSTILRETEDLSCGIFDPQGNMVVQAVTGTPGHVNSMATGVRHFLRKFSPSELREGDVLITNDPWQVSGHLNDITIVTPVFYRKRLVGFTACTGHVMDIGGRVYSADSSELFEEGFTIPIQKIFVGGKRNEQLFEFIRYNVRIPNEVIGDILALVSSNDVGSQKIVEFMEEFGLTTLDPLASQIISVSERAMRKAIKALPQGTYTNEMPIDGFDEPLKVVCTITIKDSNMVVDFSGSSLQTDRAINVVLNYTQGYSLYAVKVAVCPYIPNNDGNFRPVSVTAPEGCMLNARRPCAVAARHIIGHFLPPAVFGVLAQIIPDRVLSDSSISGNTQLDGFTSDGRRFIFNYFTSGGMGARPSKDGLSTTCFPGNVSNTPVEVIENASPLFISRIELVKDSGGAGKYRGGLGQVVSTRIRSERQATFSCMYDRLKFPPRGFFGGKNGLNAAVEVLGKRGEMKPHPKRKFGLEPGDEISVRYAGGGGFYSPLERDPERVREDVVNGYVSLESADLDYGVTLDPMTYEVDWDKTKALRRQGERKKS
jgi:N-methylhydantoinase B